MGRQSLSILLVTPYWHPSTAGGVAATSRRLAEILRADHRVTVLVPDWSAPGLAETLENGVPVYKTRLRVPALAASTLLDAVQSKATLSWAFSLPRSVWRLYRMTKRHRIQVVHLIQLSPYYSAFAIARILGGPPYTVGLRGSDVREHPGRPRVHRLLCNLIVRQASALIPVTRVLADAARQCFPDIPMLHVIPNSIPQPAEGGGPSFGGVLSIRLPPHFFLVAGALRRVKGQDVAIRAWAELRDSLPDVHLVLAGGEGERGYEQSLSRLAGELGCRGTVHFVGSLSRSDVLGLMQQARGVVLPSRDEGFPNVLLEAGVSCLPVIAAGVGGVPDIVRHDSNGLLVPPEDPSAIAEAVRRLHEDPSLARRLAQSLFETVRADFSTAREAREYYRVFTLVARRECRSTDL